MGLQYLSQLKLLCFEECNEITDEILKGFPGLTELQILSLINCDITDAIGDYFSKFRQLRKLWLENCCITDAIGNYFSRLPQLQMLDLSCNEMLEGQNGIGIQHLTELQSLRINGCEGITDNIAIGFSGLKKLRHLDLSRCPNLTGQNGMGLRHLKQLKTLRLNECEKIINEIGDDCRYLTELQELHLTGTNVTSGVTDHLEKLTELRKLCFSDNNRVDEKPLETWAFLQSLQKLETIEISDEAYRVACHYIG
jgi:Leucine-rich repeat (LRR) protein